MNNLQYNIEYLKECREDIIANGETTLYVSACDPLKVAIEAMEKQNFKTVIFNNAWHDNNNLPFAFCPSCGFKDLDGDEEYCRECGQKLEWGE